MDRLIYLSLTLVIEPRLSKSEPAFEATLGPSLASQTLTLHSVLILSGKTHGGRVWPTAYAHLDPARQDVVWPIRFMENMITSC